MVEELHLTTARLVPEPNTAAALRLTASQPHVQTLKDTKKTTVLPWYKALSSRSTPITTKQNANCVYLPISAGIHLCITVIRQ